MTLIKKTFKFLLEKTGVEKIARTCSGIEEEELMNLFLMMDLNGDGFIDHPEVSEFLSEYVALSTEREVAFLMNAMDFDQDGKLSYLDLCNFFIPGIVEQA